ncbi:MAG: DUF4870 domain-containing protein, partial [Flavitalea sp.]
INAAVFEKNAGLCKREYRSGKLIPVFFLKLGETFKMQNNSFLGTEEQPISMPTGEERTMAILSHILCLVVWLFGPLIIYLVKKDESSYVAQHAKESLNFQITLAIIGVIMLVSIIGIFFLWILGIYATIMIIIATIKASDNKIYRYPFTIRLIK